MNALYFIFFAGVALFVMNRPEAKNAMSKNFLKMVRMAADLIVIHRQLIFSHGPGDP